MTNSSPDSAASSRGHEAAVRRARAGDGEAFRELYRRFAPAVHGALLARVPAHDADDLMQEVFLTAWQRLGDLREDARLGAWLVSIARRRAVRYRARPRPAPLADGAAEVVAARPAGAAAEAGGAAEGEEILAAVRELPETYREALTMRLVEGLSGPEIAAATGLTRGSVRVHLSRGTKLLRERLRRTGIAR